MSSTSNATPKLPPNGSSAAHTFLNTRRTSLPRLRNRSRTLSHSVPAMTPSRPRASSISSTRPLPENKNNPKSQQHDQPNQAPRSRLDRAATRIGQFTHPDRNSTKPTEHSNSNESDESKLTSFKTDSSITPSASNVESAYATTRVSRTGFMERSVAGGMISAARNARRRTGGTAPTATKPAHHRLNGGFGNPWPSALKDGGMRSRGGSGSRTFFHKVAKDKRPPEEELASLILLSGRPDFDAAAAAIARDRFALAAIWIGHCTFVMRCHGLIILTDPVWSPRLGPLGPKRLVPPPCELSDLPSVIHFALLSSACYDHYDKNAISNLSSRVLKWFVPLGLKALLTTLGVPSERVVELDWWQQHVEPLPVHTQSPTNSPRDKPIDCQVSIKETTESTERAQGITKSTSNRGKNNKLVRGMPSSSLSSTTKTQVPPAQTQPRSSENEIRKEEQAKNTNPTTKTVTSSLSPLSPSTTQANTSLESDTNLNHDPTSINNDQNSNSTSNPDTNTTTTTKPVKPTPQKQSLRSSKDCAYHIICTPAQHYSVREGTLWCSWAIHTPNHSFFYCGGTGYRSIDKDADDGDTFGKRHNLGRPSCPAFWDIGRRVGPFDTAFLPIGGYRPRALMSGVQGDAIDMLAIHRDVRARRSVAHRWGTYASNDEGLLDAIRQLEFALQTGPVHEQDFTYVKHGRLHIS